MAQAAKTGTTMVSEGFVGIMKMSVEGTPADDVIAATTTENSAGGSIESGHVVYAALQNGTFNVFDARAGVVVYKSPSLPKGSSPLLSIAHSSSSNLLVTGAASGVVHIYDLRSLSPSSSSTTSSDADTLLTFKRSDSAINDLRFLSGSPASLLVATGDGFPYRVSLFGTAPAIEEEYVAHDDQGIQVIRAREGTSGEEMTIWTAGDDGIVRRY